MRVCARPTAPCATALCATAPHASVSHASRTSRHATRNTRPTPRVRAPVQGQPCGVRSLLHPRSRLPPSQPPSQVEAAQRDAQDAKVRAEEQRHSLAEKVKHAKRQWAREKATLRQSDSSRAKQARDRARSHVSRMLDAPSCTHRRHAPSITTHRPPLATPTAHHQSPAATATAHRALLTGRLQVEALKRAVIKLKSERDELRRELLRAPSERLGGALGSGACSATLGTSAEGKAARSAAAGGAL